MRFRLIAFLFGAMLAVIPLILHLLSQRQGPRVYFPTLRFLKLCVHKTARRRRVENLLLLIFRMALLGLLAMALAEPFVPSTLAGSGPRDTVIILDNSYSMSTRELGTERFRTAKEIAADLLRSSERVSLIITSGPEADRFLHLLPVDNDLRSTVSNCRLFAGKADITAALTKAYNLLGDYGSTSARIFVLSDLQANSFPTVEDRLPSDRAPDVPVILYDCGRSAVRNAALVDLHARGGLGLSGSSVELVAAVFNPSEVAINDLPVTVYLAGRPVADRRVSLPPRSRAKLPSRGHWMASRCRPAGFSFPPIPSKSTTGSTSVWPCVRGSMCSWFATSPGRLPPSTTHTSWPVRSTLGPKTRLPSLP